MQMKRRDLDLKTDEVLTDGVQQGNRRNIGEALV